MINANIRLKALLCHAAAEVGGGNDPYVWPTFFYLDAVTYFQSKKVITHTPHANWTTRGVFPNGISAGDVVDIPDSLGDFQVTLNPSFGLAAVGTIFVLIDEDGTPGDAIRAGHEEFASAVDDALNEYVNQASSPEELSPTPEQIRTMANHIQGRVKSAIKDAIPLHHILDNPDDVIGFGYFILGSEQLQQVATRPFGRLSFTNRITNTARLFGATFTNDFEVFGDTTIVDDGQAPGQGNSQYAPYAGAVENYLSIEREIADAIQRLQQTPSERRELAARLAHLRHDLRPQSLQLIEDAEMLYLHAQAEDSGRRGSLAGLRVSAERQPRSGRTEYFRTSALVVPPTVVEPEQ